MNINSRYSLFTFCLAYGSLIFRLRVKVFMTDNSITKLDCAHKVPILAKNILKTSIVWKKKHLL